MLSYLNVQLKMAINNLNVFEVTTDLFYHVPSFCLHGSYSLTVPHWNWIYFDVLAIIYCLRYFI
jgi:hypothetical protein